MSMTASEILPIQSRKQTNGSRYKQATEVEFKKGRNKKKTEAKRSDNKRGCYIFQLKEDPSNRDALAFPDAFLDGSLG